jgi:hypothetical protein
VAEAISAKAVVEAVKPLIDDQIKAARLCRLGFAKLRWSFRWDHRLSDYGLT